MDRVIVLLIVLAATGAFAAWWRARDGRVRMTATPGSPAVMSVGAAGSRWEGLPVEAADVVVAVSPTTSLTLVEFTAPDCGPCARTKVLLDEATADRDDVAVATLDVGEALDLARAHRIMRAPTTLLVSDEGHLLGRVSGIPRAAELTALLEGTRRRQAA